MKGHDLLALGKISTKRKLQSFILNSISTIFKKESMEKFWVDCNNILTVWIDIIGFHVNIISELGFFHSKPLFTSYSFGRPLSHKVT